MSTAQSKFDEDDQLSKHEMLMIYTVCTRLHKTDRRTKRSGCVALAACRSDYEHVGEFLFRRYFILK